MGSFETWSDGSPMYYRIGEDGRTPIPTDLLGMADCLEMNPIRHTYFYDRATGKRVAWVSTIFLGFDHRHIGTGEDPLLFETMIFGGHLDQNQLRFATWEEAMAVHKRINFIVWWTELLSEFPGGFRLARWLFERKERL